MRARLMRRVPSWGGEGCWECIGTRNWCGYGVIGSKATGVRRQLMAHRVSWELANGPVPDGMCVCHSCDNPACVRPDHLFVADHAGNMADKVAKGRQFLAQGEKHGRAKLTDDNVRAIRAAVAEGVAQSELARSHGVSSMTISGIVTRKRWKHLP